MSAARSKQEDARDGIPSQRQYKVGEIIKKALVETFERVEIRDPALSGTSITISQVEADGDREAGSWHPNPVAPTLAVVNDLNTPPDVALTTS